MKVAIIDSGVYPEHPHVGGVAGGAGIGFSNYLDRLGHGTCVTAVIREKAPHAELYAVKVFDRTLSCSIAQLVEGIRWAILNRMDLINLSLGTANPEHSEALQSIALEANAAGSRIVAAYEDAGVRWLPGILPGVIPVVLNWDVPRETVVLSVLPDGRSLYAACGYPRPIPGVSPEQNLKGISFAVANVTGYLAGQAQSGVA